MEENKCEFCNKFFKNKYILKNHKTRTKSCLEIQRKNNINIIEDFKNCIHCLGSFASNVIKRHVDTCKIKKKMKLKLIKN